jgi:predicted TIM-barrel fold metal-dependent hydrolase
LPLLTVIKVKIGPATAGGREAMPELDTIVASLARNSDVLPLAVYGDSPPKEFALVSADDHLLEPRDIFEGRMPAKFAEHAPRVVRDGSGKDVWLFEETPVPISGANALKSWEPEHYTLGSVNFDDVRRAMWDVNLRVEDMDRAGILASLCFPSQVFGFAGTRFMKFRDAELGLAAMRAYNAWQIEDWTGAHPDRFIPSQIAWLLDAEIAAAEIRRNAERGYRAVSFTENPEPLGLPSLHTAYWDPFLEACVESGTVINLHVGSSGLTLKPSSDSPLEVPSALFTVSAVAAAVDWVYSKIPVRFPDIKIVLSEGGIGWVPMLLDRFDYITSEWVPDGPSDTWRGVDLTPREVFQRNFWFTAYYDPSALRHLGDIGIDRVMYESDYPHADSSWPDTQLSLGAQFRDLDAAAIERITYRNACELYGHPIPTDQYLRDFLTS